MYKDPGAKLSSRSTPKINDKPEATKKSSIAVVKPLTACAPIADKDGKSMANS
jgi:hypothetical protein